jgi:cytosine deaminase
LSVELVVRNGMLWNGLRVDFAVEEGRFAAVGPRLHLTGRREIDLKGAPVLPGLVDLHEHIDKAYVLNRVGAADSLEAAIRLMQGYTKTMTVDDVVQRGRGVYRRLMRSGTCAARTHVNIDDLTGLRGVEGLIALKQEHADRVRTQVVAMPRGDADLGDPAQVERLRTALRMGCDAVGGSPSQSADPRRYVEAVLDLAQETGCLVDLHVDEAQAPDASTLTVVARETLRRDMVGRVSAGHCSTLSLLDDAAADEIIELVRTAELSISTCPFTSLFLQGGGGRAPGFRGLTRVKDLLAAGVNVCCGSDNIRDPFNPFGNGDLVLAALILGLACRMGAHDERELLLRTITEAGAQAMRLSDYGLRIGARADLVAFDCASTDEILAEQPARRLVLLNGKPMAA